MVPFISPNKEILPSDEGIGRNQTRMVGRKVRNFISNVYEKLWDLAFGTFYHSVGSSHMRYIHLLSYFFCGNNRNSSSWFNGNAKKSSCHFPLSNSLKKMKKKSQPNNKH
jgi:hypothetical protein